MNPEYAEAYYNLAISFEDMDDYKRALDVEERYIQLAKDIPFQKNWYQKPTVICRD